MKKLIHSVKASEELPVYSDLYTPEDLLELLSQITELGESPVGMLPMVPYCLPSEILIIRFFPP